MILRHIVVERFRTLFEFEADFTAGVNVVKGPNEAGKTTLQSAIIALLFQKPSLTKTARESVQSWYCDQLPKLDARIENEAGTWQLVKDFHNGSAKLVPAHGSPITGDREVMARVADIAGIESRQIYEATACLLQGQWARVTAGKDLKQVLQANLSGGAAGADAQRILDDLEKAITNLERGVWRPAPKNPGPIARVRNRREQLQHELQKARERNARLQGARTELQEAQEALRTATEKLAEKRALEKRATHYIQLKNQEENLQKTATKLHERVTEIRQLNEAMQRDRERLQKLAEIDPQTKEDVQRHVDSRHQRQEQLAEAREHLARLHGQQKDLHAASQQLPDRALSSDTLQRARNLRDDAAQARIEAAQLGETIGRHHDLLQRAGRRKVFRNVVTALGITIAGAGAALFTRSPIWAIAAILGLAIAALSRLIRIPASIDQLTEQIEGLQEDRRQCTQRAERRSAQLDQLLQEVSCDDLDDLAKAVRKQEDTRDDLQAKLDRLTGEISTIEKSIATHQEVIKKLDEQIQQVVRETGVATVEQFLEQAEQRRQLLQTVRHRQQKLDGILGDETEQQLDARYNEAAVALRGVRAELDSPRLRMAHMSQQGYQSLLAEIDRLESEIETNERKQRNARAIIDTSEYDTEAVTVLEGRKAALDEREALLWERNAVYTATRDAIAEARDQTLSTVTEAVAPQMSRLLAQLTANRYRRVKLDSDMSPQVNLPPLNEGLALQGDPDSRGSDLSWATYEQVFLAARLAIIDMIWPAGGPPLLLDDPLVSFDAGRRRAALEVLSHFAQNHQIIIFTCGAGYDPIADNLVEMPQPSYP